MHLFGLTQLLRSSETAVVGLRAATNGYSGVEAAETGESDARERERECCARDGIVGVAQYVSAALYMVQREESTR